MPRMLRATAAFVVCTCLIATVSASAAPITVHFDFTANDSDDPAVAPGSLLGASLTYDSATPDLNPSPSQGSFAITELRVTLPAGDLVLTESASMTLRVGSGGRFEATASSGADSAFLQLQYFDTVFPTDALPFALGPLNTGDLYVNDFGVTTGPYSLRGSVSHFVPEPESLGLMALLALAWRARPRARRPS